MGEELTNRLNNPEYKNWLKVSIALIQSKEALHGFTEDVIKEVHDQILQRTSSSRCDGTCKTNKGKEPSCVSCTKWVNEIKSYNKGQLNWKNTDPTKWHTDPWEIAKCFMNPQGSKATAALNTGPEKTDLSGILNVLVNCKKFRESHLKDKKLPEKVREIRNKVMHCPTMTISESMMKCYVDSIVALLEDERNLKNQEICKEKVKLIKSLRDEDLMISTEAEVDCIDSALRSHELLLESGDDIESETRKSFEILSKFIYKHKDLERKFNSKLNQIDDRLENVDARMTAYEVTCGELKGKIERLEEQLNELQKERVVRSAEGELSNASKVVQRGKSSFKNSLHCYAVKKKLGMPKYSSEQTDSGTFISTVSISNTEFKSAESKASKKEAEQSAAEMALNSFLKKVSDEEEESSSPPSEKPIVLPKLQREKNKNYKNLLQEYAQKQKALFPQYDTKRSTESALFTSSVFFDGAWFTPDSPPQGRKVDAEQLAAQFVLAYLEKPKDTMSENIGTSDQLLPIEVPEKTSPKINSKTYMAILNEHVQKLPCGPPDYKFVEVEKRFSCTVTVDGKIYESSSPQNSKKEAKESAAMKACSQLQLLDNVATQSDCQSSQNGDFAGPFHPDHLLNSISNHGSDESQANASDVTESPDGTDPIQNDVSDVSGNKDGNNAANFRSKLNQYALANYPDVRAIYEDIPCESGFLSRVTIGNKIYEGQNPQKSKKEAREMVAKQAWCDLNQQTVSSAEGSPPSSIPYQGPRVDKLVDGRHSQNAEFVENDADTTCKHEQTESVPDQRGTSTNVKQVQMNFKGALLENAGQSKIVPEYVTQEVGQTKEFFSRVFLGKRCFKGEKAKRKKDAEQNAAKIAIQELKSNQSGSAQHCIEILKEYHRKLDGIDPGYPKYGEATSVEGERFTALINIMKEWKVKFSEPRASKKQAEEFLAELAIKLLREEGKPIQDAGKKTCKSVLNEFRQIHFNSIKYNVTGQQSSFCGDLCFYTREEYEALCPQESIQKAETSAAMSACYALCLI